MASALTTGGFGSAPAGTIPRSARMPWTRAGLSGVIALLLPFTWVLQLDGCTESVEGRATGLDLLRDVQLEPLDVLLVAFLVGLALLEPRASAFIASPRTRTWLHFAGLIATTTLVARGVSLVLGTTQVRTIQFAGYLVLGAMFLAFLDAAGRVALGAFEWTDENRRARERGG